MASTPASAQISTTGALLKGDLLPKSQIGHLTSVSSSPWKKKMNNNKKAGHCCRPLLASAPPTPPELSQKVSESIEEAVKACAEDPSSGECRAAWDEVEELSSTASHARDKMKGADVLEEYCKEHPENGQCRTYDD